MEEGGWEGGDTWQAVAGVSVLKLRRPPRPREVKCTIAVTGLRGVYHRARMLVTASMATIHRTSTLVGDEAALLLAAAEAFAPVCARPEPVALAAVTPSANSARKPSRARA